MIKINFKEPDEPDWIAWRQDCEKATEELIKLVKMEEEYEISDLYKKKEIKQKYYISIDGPFGGKCAYCETRIVSDQYGDMEHYRPKKAVTDEHGNNIRIEDEKGQIIPHPGYYWLAYDWRNLLPACELCNRTNPGNKNIGKQNKFPVKDGFYAKSPGEEEKEKPLLINPLLEDPEEHFVIEFKTGLLSGDEKGKCCIDIFGLNLRSGLQKARKEAYTSTLGLIIKFFSSNDETEEKECAEDLLDIIMGKKPYSLVGRTLIKKKSPGLIEDLEKCFSVNT